MSVSAGFLDRAAADTGHNVASLEKVVRLGELAADRLAVHPAIRWKLMNVRRHRGVPGGE